MTWEQGRAWAVLQYSHCAHDTAKLGVQAGGELGAQASAGRHGRWGTGRAAWHGRAQGALGAQGMALRHGWLGGLGAACARWLGQIGVLCT